QRPLTCIRHGSFRQSLSTLPARRRPRTSSQFRDDVVFFGRNLLEVADELFTLIRRKTLDEVAVLFRLRRRRQTFQFCAPFVTDHALSPLNYAVGSGTLDSTISARWSAMSQASSTDPGIPVTSTRPRSA